MISLINKKPEKITFDSYNMSHKFLKDLIVQEGLDAEDALKMALNIYVGCLTHLSKLIIEEKEEILSDFIRKLEALKNEKPDLSSPYKVEKN